MAKPNSKAPLGQGGRFAAVEQAAAASGARNPGAVAYAAGVKKYGKAKMTSLAQHGRQHNSPGDGTGFSSIPTFDAGDFMARETAMGPDKDAQVGAIPQASRMKPV